MKGTGIIRITPRILTCAWCDKPIMPKGEFIWWRKIDMCSQAPSGFAYHLLPTHPECWREIEEK